MIPLSLAHRLTLGLLGALVLAALTSSPAGAEGAVAMRRVAVVVGANAAAPGRKPLRFALSDARAVADVLRDRGGFAAADVRVLLEPTPEAVLAALDDALRAAGKVDVDTMVFFYYSGHADTASLFPSGRPLSVAELRRRLDDDRAAMRIGVIDACRGGGWTGSKGLSESQVFDIAQAFHLATEGSVLISSSAGLEEAHESAALRGSFFTHHWNAALRGAADRNSDDKVTLGEAFEYARVLTIRDTALETETPQHPSFWFNLKGRGDPPLAELSPGSSVVELDQRKGPLQVIHLGTGLLVAELPRGQRRVRVSLSPGRYLVRRRADKTIQAREVQLGAGQRVAVAESSLSSARIGQFQPKGDMDAEISTQAEPVHRPSPPSEFLLSYGMGQTTYTVSEQSPTSNASYSSNQDYWYVQGGYLLRHGRHLATRFGLGFIRPNRAAYHNFGNGAVMTTIGEQVSWPLVVKRSALLPWSSRYLFEPYVTAQMSAWVEIDRGAGGTELPYQIQANLAGGFRFSYFYAQGGAAWNFLPNDFVVDWSGGDYVQRKDPKIGPAFEAGIRFVADFGLGGRTRRVGH